MRNLHYITLQNLYNCLSTVIVYCVGITIFPIVYVLGLYNYN